MYDQTAKQQAQQNTALDAQLKAAYEAGGIGPAPSGQLRTDYGVLGATQPSPPSGPRVAEKITQLMNRLDQIRHSTSQISDAIAGPRPQNGADKVPSPNSLLGALESCHDVASEIENTLAFLHSRL